jgi:hypothetical protein
MNYKISIVIVYANNQIQLIKTIKNIELTKHDNYEIIIVNNSNENIDFLINNYKNIKIFKNPQVHYNMCSSYNFGFLQTSGDIIIIQKFNCLYNGDVLKKINDNLKHNDCMIFNCFFLENEEQNIELYEKNNIDTIISNNKNNWFIHHKLNLNITHYCIALFKKKLEKINYFSQKYKDGYCFEDDDFSRKIKLSHTEFYYYSEKFNDDNTFVIHQFYEKPNNTKEILQLWNINRNFFVRDHKKYVNMYLNFYLNKNIIYQKPKIIYNETIFNVLIDKKEIYYTANISDMVFKEDFNNTLQDSIFLLKCKIKNYNKKFIKINNNKITINKNCIEFEGTFKNLIKNGLIFDSNTIQILDITLELKKINYNNNGFYSVSNEKWLYPKINKIAFIYLKELNFENYTNIQNFYDFNPDWIINIYTSKYTILNEKKIYYNILLNLKDIQFINLENIPNYITEENIYDFAFIKIMSENTGLWFNLNEIIFINNVLNENFNYLNFNNDKYNNNLIISENKKFYNHLYNNINSNFKSFDLLTKQLFKNYALINNTFNITSTNYNISKTQKEKNIYTISNYYKKIISKFNETFEFLTIINNNIYYEFYNEKLKGTYELIDNYLIIKWNNNVINYYIKNIDDVYVLQIFNNFNLRKYNDDNNSNYDNLHDIINFNFENMNFLCKYCD